MKGCWRASSAEGRKLGSILRVAYRKLRKLSSSVRTLALRLVDLGMRIWN